MSEFIPASPEDLADMAKANYPAEEIAEYRRKSMELMAANNYTADEIQKYYGIKEPDMSPAKKMVKDNIALAQAEEAASKADGKPKKEKREPIDTAAQPVEAKDLLDGLAAGWGTSVTGLFTAGQKSPIAISENSSRAVRIASMVSQFAGDIPAMAAGMVAGGAAGSEVPVVGNVIGAAAGGFAVPSAMRQLLIDQYEKGDIQDASDFADRLVAASWEGLKGAVTGAATAVVGGPAGVYLGTAGKLTAEAATMATVASALEGHLPSADDFIDGALMMGGFHALGYGVKKLRGVYKETGLKPEEVNEIASNDPVVKQELLSANEGLPPPLEKLKTADLPKPSEPVEKVINEAEDVALARKNLRSKVGEKLEPEKKAYTWDRFYQEFVDKFDPIKAIDEGAYKLFRMAGDFKAKVKHTMESGTLNYKDLSVRGESLKSILEPVKDQIKQLEDFMIAERGMELERRGIESGFNAADMKKIIAADKGKFGAIAKKVVKFQNENLAYLRDSGRISEVLYDKLVKMGKKYVPMSRLLEPEDFEGMAPKGRSNALKKIRGSDLGVQSPMQSIVESTEMVMRIAEQNRAKTALVDAVEKSGDTEAFKKVSGNKLIKVDAAPEVNKLLEEVNNTLKEIDPDFEGLTLDEFNVFRSQEKQLAANQFEIWRKGKREVYEIQDEMVAKAIKALDGNPASQNALFKLARWFTGWKRVGITITPEFVAKNFIRDQMTQGVFSKQGTLPFTDVLIAMGDLWKKNDHYYNWLKSGGANGAFLELNTKYLEGEVFKIDAETGFIGANQNVFKKAIDVAALAGNLIESAPRLAEFKRAAQGATSGPAVFEAGFQSREITLDFQRVGLKTQALNSIAAFMNAQIQGLDKSVRAMNEGAKQIKADPTNLNNPIYKAGLMLTAPSLMLWLAQKDDERYKEIPQWQKDLFWNIVTDDWGKAESDEEWTSLPPYMVKDTPEGKFVNRGIIFRIPKPQELGLVFATLPERIAEQFFGSDPDALEGLGKTFVTAMMPHMIPDIAQPAAEHFTNYNMFTSRPLIPQYLENELPAYRHTEYTSDTAKALGKLVGTIPKLQETNFASPMVIENYVKNWTGTLGGYALQLSSAGLRAVGAVDSPEKPAWSVADIPVVKAFMVRHPSNQAESIQRFYDRANKIEQITNTRRNQMKLGHTDEVAYIDRQFGETLNNVNGFKQALSAQGRFIRNVYNQDYTPDEKRQLIDSTYYQMIEIARLANTTMDQFEKMMKDMNKGAKE